MLTLDALYIQQGEFQLRADFSIPTGSKVAIIGPSGAGKSTLLNLIAGFEASDSGSILWNDVDLTNAEPSQRPISILFQDNNLFPHLTAFQNVALGVRPSLKLNSPEIDTVNDALDRVGLTGFESRKPAALSGGQQSRVALARVLIRKRPLLLLDEPFSALGPALKAEMLDLVGALVQSSGATMLMVTHEPRDAEQIAGLTILVADGVARAPRNTAEIFANPPQALKDYIGD